MNPKYVLHRTVYRIMHELTLMAGQPFSLDLTLSCGQVFRWEKGSDGWWRGIVDNNMIRIRQDGEVLRFEGVNRQFIEHYFSLDHDLRAITASFDRDPFIHAAVEQCRGLRLIRQPPWECLISYICSTNSNIPMIKKRINLMAQAFGDPIETDGGTYYGFPKPRSLVGSCAAVLSECKMGYRGGYVKKTACDITDEREWARSISSLPSEDARKTLMELQGVGPKAADCVLLFAFQKYESFPVDVWIRRIMGKHYLPNICGSTSLSNREYDAIRKFAKDYFGTYCGYAQEYLFAARED
ncbi:MAG: hypothetical protein A4E35_02033 [Methanoregula sp. PtaU1.Bin051]|nr:MAG: hypothetical protein A4E35_02033 [Methanoregula sp. PtaU1.Bin051]